MKVQIIWVILVALIVSGCSGVMVYNSEKQFRKMPIRVHSKLQDTQIQFYLNGDEPTQAYTVVGNIEDSSTTNALFKRAHKSCSWVFYSSLIDIARKSSEQGGDAIMDIKSTPEAKLPYRDFVCDDGFFTSSVNLQGTLIKFTDHEKYEESELTTIPYEINLSINSMEDAVTTIERIYYQEPSKYAPTKMHINKEYIHLSFGNMTLAQTKSTSSSSSSNLGSSSHRAYTYGAQSSNYSALANHSGENNSSLVENRIEKNKRVYFDSISKINLYKNAEMFVVEFEISKGRVSDKVYMYNKKEAVEFISAIDYMREKAK